MLKTILSVVAHKVQERVAWAALVNFSHGILMAAFGTVLGASFGNLGVVETTNLQFAFQQVERKGPEVAHVVASCLPKIRHDLVSLCETAESRVAKSGAKTLARITSAVDCAPWIMQGRPTV